MVSATDDEARCGPPLTPEQKLALRRAMQFQAELIQMPNNWSLESRITELENSIERAKGFMAAGFAVLIVAAMALAFYIMAKC